MWSEPSKRFPFSSFCIFDTLPLLILLIPLPLSPLSTHLFSTSIISFHDSRDSPWSLTSLLQNLRTTLPFITFLCRSLFFPRSHFSLPSFSLPSFLPSFSLPSFCDGVNYDGRGWWREWCHEWDLLRLWYSSTQKWSDLMEKEKITPSNTHSITLTHLFYVNL